MNYRDKQRVNKLVDDLLAFYVEKEKIERIALEGPTIDQMMVDYLGELPQSSAYKVDGVSIKADRCQQHVLITRDMLNAHNVMRELIESNRRNGKIQYLSIVTWPMKRKQYNPETGATWTREDIAAMLWMSLDVYLEFRESACNRLIQIDRFYNPQLYNKSA